MEKSENQCLTLPLLPLRDVVVFPYMVMPLFVGREESILALEAAMEHDKKLFLIGQKILKSMYQERKTCIQWAQWLLFCRC